MALESCGRQSRQAGRYWVTEEFFTHERPDWSFMGFLFWVAAIPNGIWFYLLSSNQGLAQAFSGVIAPAVAALGVFGWPLVVLAVFPLVVPFALLCLFLFVRYWFRWHFPKRVVVERVPVEVQIKNERNEARQEEARQVALERKREAEERAKRDAARKAKEALEKEARDKAALEASQRAALKQRVARCHSMDGMTHHAVEPLVFNLPEWWWPLKKIGLATVDIAAYGQLPPDQSYFGGSYRTIGPNKPQERGIYLQGMARRTTLNEALVVLPTVLPGTSPQNCVMFILDEKDRVLYLHNPSRRETYYAPNISPQLRKEEALIKIELALPFLQSLYVDAIMGGDPNANGGGWT